MKHFDFIIIGAGIAGLMASYMLKEYKTLLIDKKGVLEGASAAAGAFLFPKIGKKSSYTDFINKSILKSFEFYENLGIDTHKKGVLILPRNKKDVEKFKEYEKEIDLPFEKKENGFFFKDGGFIEVDEVREKINVPFLKENINILKKEGEFWRVNDFLTKNVILATGYENLIDIPYIQIRPVWGERIEIQSEEYKMKNKKLDFNIFYHKNCSVAKIEDKLRIGATHKRNCFNCEVNEKEAFELIEKAREIADIKEFKIKDIKAGFRAASIDYFPVVGKIIDVKKTLLNQPKIVKGEKVKKFFYYQNLYIINGMGGRGFSNSVMCAMMLKNHILKNNLNLDKIDTSRLFIKWARKEGDRYLSKEKNVKS